MSYSEYTCPRCGDTFGIAGESTGSDEDFEMDRYHNEQIEWHQSGQCSARTAPMPLPYEELLPVRPYARRNVKTRTDSGYDVTASAQAPPLADSLDYGPFSLVGHVSINWHTQMKVSCEAEEIDELIRILRGIQAIAIGSGHD